MKRILRFLAPTAAVALVVSLATPASAQPPGRSSYNSRLQRPAVSPYNLLYRDGFNRNNTVSDYFTLVRPQIQQQAINQQQYQSMRQLQSEVQEAERGLGGPYSRQMIRPTGHAAGYMTMSPWYGGMNTAGMAGGRGGSPRR